MRGGYVTSLETEQLDVEEESRVWGDHSGVTSLTVRVFGWASELGLLTY